FRGETISDNLVSLGNGPLTHVYEGGWAGLWHIAELWGWGAPRPTGEWQSGCGPWCAVRHGPQCRPLVVTQLFRSNERIHRRLTYETPYAYFLHRHPPACDTNVLAMGDTMLDISNLD